MVAVNDNNDNAPYIMAAANNIKDSDSHTMDRSIRSIPHKRAIIFLDAHKTYTYQMLGLHDGDDIIVSHRGRHHCRSFVRYHLDRVSCHRTLCFAHRVPSPVSRQVCVHRDSLPSRHLLLHSGKRYLDASIYYWQWLFVYSRKL